MRNSLLTDLQYHPVHGAENRAGTSVYCGHCRGWLSVTRDEFGYPREPEWFLSEHMHVRHGPQGLYVCEDCPSTWSLDSEGPRLHGIDFPDHRVRAREAS